MTWSNIKHFTPNEFPGDVNLADPKLFIALDQARELLGERVYPSPVLGALARIGGSITSQHYVGPDHKNITRQATAVDVFAEGIPFENFMKLYDSKLFNGIGVYLNTRGPNGTPWVMFHLDIREVGKGNSPLIWVAVKGIDPKTGGIITRYRYPQNDSRYWELFKKDNLYRECCKA